MQKNLRCIIFNAAISVSTYVYIACLSKNNIVLKLDWTELWTLDSGVHIFFMKKKAISNQMALGAWSFMY